MHLVWTLPEPIAALAIIAIVGTLVILNLIYYKSTKKRMTNKKTFVLAILGLIAFSVFIAVPPSYLLYQMTIEPPDCLSVPRIYTMDVLSTSKSSGVSLMNTGGVVQSWEDIVVTVSDKNASYKFLKDVPELCQSVKKCVWVPAESGRIYGFDAGDRLDITNISLAPSESLHVKLIFSPQWYRLCEANTTIWEGEVTLTE